MPTQTESLNSVQASNKTDEPNPDTKENEVLGLRAEKRIVVTCILPSDLGVADMISDENTVYAGSQNQNSSEESDLSFVELHEFGLVHLRQFWSDIQSVDENHFELTSIKLTRRDSQPDKVSITFTRQTETNLRQSGTNLTEDEKEAVDMLFNIAFGGGKFFEAQENGSQEFVSVLLWDWQTETHQTPDQHFRLQGGRFSLMKE